MVEWVMVIQVEQSVEQVLSEEIFQAAVVKRLPGRMDYGMCLRNERTETLQWD